MPHLPSPGVCMTARHTGSPAIMYISSIHIHRTHCLSVGLIGVVVNVAPSSHNSDTPSPYAYPSLISFGYMYRYTTPHLIKSHYTPQPEACDKHCNLRRYADGFYQICDGCRDTDPSMHAEYMHSIQQLVISHHSISFSQFPPLRVVTNYPPHSISRSY